MKKIFMIVALFVASSACAQTHRVVIDPRIMRPNPFAPECKFVKAHWSLVVKDASWVVKGAKNKQAAEERRQSDIGYFVKFLRQDLRRCKLNPSHVKETEQSLQRYDRAYLRAVQKARGGRYPTKQ